jgi:hypothetical protein
MIKEYFYVLIVLRIHLFNSIYQKILGFNFSFHQFSTDCLNISYSEAFKTLQNLSLVWWHRLVIPALRKLKQEVGETFSG